MVPGEDFIFDAKVVTVANGYYQFPSGELAFSGKVPASYASFQQMWVLQRRLFPRVPCPENTPLPNRRVAKETRSKMYSMYLRPWTLAKGLRTTLVPFITDLAEGSATSCEPASSAQNMPSARQGWKSYLRNVLPHAEKGIRSFMLACLADGHRFEDDEEGRAKGPSPSLSMRFTRQCCYAPTEEMRPRPMGRSWLHKQRSKLWT